MPVLASISEPLETRDWTKWHLDHPYVKKGHKAHLTAAEYNASLKSGFKEHTVSFGSFAAKHGIPETDSHKAIFEEAHDRAYADAIKAALVDHKTPIQLKWMATNKGTKLAKADAAKGDHASLAEHVGAASGYAMAAKHFKAAGGKPEPVSEETASVGDSTGVPKTWGELGTGDKLTWNGEQVTIAKVETLPNGNIKLTFTNGKEFDHPEGFTLISSHQPVIKAAPHVQVGIVPSEKDLDTVVAAHVAHASVSPPATSGKLPSSDAELAKMEKIGGPLGSNGGQWYKAANGDKYLVKPAKSDDHAYNEVAVNTVYEVAGSKVKDTGILHHDNGIIGIISKSIDPLAKWQTNPTNQAEARKEFGLDALTSNYDALGLVDDNAHVDSAGHIVRLDNGGGGFFRAQGAAKPSFKVGTWHEKPDAADINTLRDPGINSQSRFYGQGHIALSDVLPSIQQARELDTDAVDAKMEEHGVPKPFREKFLAVIRDRQWFLSNHPEVSPSTAGDDPLVKEVLSEAHTVTPEKMATISAPTPITQLPVTDPANPYHPSYLAGVNLAKEHVKGMDRTQALTAKYIALQKVKDHTDEHAPHLAATSQGEADAYGASLDAHEPSEPGQKHTSIAQESDLKESAAKDWISYKDGYDAAKVEGDMNGDDNAKEELGIAEVDYTGGGMEDDAEDAYIAGKVGGYLDHLNKDSAHNYQPSVNVHPAPEPSVSPPPEPEPAATVFAGNVKVGEKVVLTSKMSGAHYGSPQTPLTVTSVNLLGNSKVKIGWGPHPAGSETFDTSASAKVYGHVEPTGAPSIAHPVLTDPQHLKPGDVYIAAGYTPKDNNGYKVISVQNDPTSDSVLVTVKPIESIAGGQVKTVELPKKDADGNPDFVQLFGHEAPGSIHPTTTVDLFGASHTPTVLPTPVEKHASDIKVGDLISGKTSFANGGHTFDIPEDSPLVVKEIGHDVDGPTFHFVQPAPWSKLTFKGTDPVTVHDIGVSTAEPTVSVPHAKPVGSPGTYKAATMVKDMKVGHAFYGESTYNTNTAGSEEDPAIVTSIDPPDSDGDMTIHYSVAGQAPSYIYAKPTTKMIVLNADKGVPFADDPAYKPYTMHASPEQMREYHTKTPAATGSNSVTEGDYKDDEKLAYSMGRKYAEEHMDEVSQLPALKKLIAAHNKAIGAGNFTTAANLRGQVDEVKAQSQPTAVIKLPKKKSIPEMHYNSPTVQEAYLQGRKDMEERIKAQAVDQVKASFARDPFGPKSTMQKWIQGLGIGSYPSYADPDAKQEYAGRMIGQRDAAREFGWIDPSDEANAVAGKGNVWTLNKDDEFPGGVKVKSVANVGGSNKNVQRVTMVSSKGETVIQYHRSFPAKFALAEHKKYAVPHVAPLKPIPAPTMEQAKQLALGVKNDPQFSNYEAGKKGKGAHYILGYLEGKAGAEKGDEAAEKFTEQAKTEYYGTGSASNAKSKAQGKYQGSMQAIQDKVKEKQLIAEANQYNDDPNFKPPAVIEGDEKSQELADQYRVGYATGKTLGYQTNESDLPTVQQAGAESLAAKTPGTPEHAKALGASHGLTMAVEEKGQIADAMAPFANDTGFQAGQYQIQYQMSYIKGWAEGKAQGKGKSASELGTLKEAAYKVQTEFPYNQTGPKVNAIGKYQALTGMKKDLDDREKLIAAGNLGKGDANFHGDKTAHPDDYAIGYGQGKAGTMGKDAEESAASLHAAQEGLSSETAGSADHAQARGKVDGIIEGIEQTAKTDGYAAEFAGESNFSPPSSGVNKVPYIVGYKQAHDEASKPGLDLAALEKLKQEYNDQYVQHVAGPTQWFGKGGTQAVQQVMADVKNKADLIATAESMSGDPHYHLPADHQDEYKVAFAKGHTNAIANSAADGQMQANTADASAASLTPGTAEHASEIGKANGLAAGVDKVKNADTIGAEFAGESNYTPPEGALKVPYILGYKQAHDEATAPGADFAELNQKYHQLYMQNTGPKEVMGSAGKAAVGQVKTDLAMKAKYLQQADLAKGDEMFKPPGYDPTGEGDEAYKIGYAKGKTAGFDEKAAPDYQQLAQAKVSSTEQGTPEHATALGNLHGVAQSIKLTAASEEFKKDSNYKPPTGVKAVYNGGYADGKSAASKLSLPEALDYRTKAYNVWIEAPEDSDEEKSASGRVDGASQAIADMGGEDASVAKVISNSQEFLSAFQKAQKFTNLGHKEIIPEKIPVSEGEAMKLDAYRVGKFNAEKAAEDEKDTSKLTDRADTALAKSQGSVSPSEQAAFLGMHHAYQSAAEKAKKPEKPVEEEKPVVEEAEPVPVDPKSLPIYAQTVKKAQNLVLGGATSRTLYKLAGGHKEDDPEGEAQHIAYSDAAKALDQAEGEKPIVGIEAHSAPAMTPEEIATMEGKASGAIKPEVTPSSEPIDEDLAHWAYDQGRAIGLSAAMLAKSEGATASDIEAAANHHEDLAAETVGLIQRKHMGIAKMLHRVAEAQHNNKDDITTSKNAGSPKPDVSYTPPSATISQPAGVNGGTSKAVGGAYGSKGPAVEVKFTPAETAAIKDWTQGLRWNGASSIYKALNWMMAGQDPKEKGNATDAGIKHAKTMLKVANEKSVPSKQTIYRKTAGAEWASGQLDKVKADLAAGKEVTVSEPISSHTYSIDVWHGSYWYIIEPGAMTADIGPYGSYPGEVETVTGGLFQITAVKQVAGHTEIHMKQIQHYAN